MAIEWLRWHSFLSSLRHRRPDIIHADRSAIEPDQNRDDRSCAFPVEMLTTIADDQNEKIARPLKGALALLTSIRRHYVSVKNLSSRKR